MDGERGFTLVELLAALVVGSLLMIALAGVSSDMVRDLGRSGSRSKPRELLDAQQLLHRLFDSAQFEQGKTSLSVQGDEATALIAAPLALGTSGPVVMHLETRRQKDGEALQLRFAPRGLETLPEIATRPVVLISGQRTIHIDTPDGSGKDRRQVLITLEDQQRQVRTLAFTSPVNGDGACRFDPISMACRQ